MTCTGECPPCTHAETSDVFSHNINNVFEITFLSVQNKQCVNSEGNDAKSQEARGGLIYHKTLE